MRGIDQRRFIASMLSVPLSWHESVVGVLNIQTEQTARLRRVGRGPAAGHRGPARRDRREGPPQREAEARVEALKAIDEARTELIAMVTHELRTPLAVVRAYTELLAEEPPLDGRESRDPVRRRTRAAGTTRRWTRSSGSTGWSTRSSRPSASSRTRPADVVPTDVEAPIAEVVGGAPAAPPQATGSRSDAGIRRFALADPPRLRQILEHLVENAVKYAPPETTITIDCALVEGFVRIGVTDEGPGIPEEWRERIFEPYARRETHTARGSGIGLYAAKRLAESMGARLWCEPAEPDRGPVRHRPARRGRGRET